MTRSTIASLATDAARRFGNAIAVTIAGEASLSFADVDEQAARFAGGLADLGVKQGDRVILHLPNGLDWIVAYHAIARMGAVVVPANILLSGAELTFMAADTQATVAILDCGKAEVDLGQTRKIVSGGVAGAYDFADVAKGEPLAVASVSPDDLFTIAYTSGTTGRSKGAMLTHGNIFNSVAMTATVHVRTAHDRIYSALPFPHVYGNVVMNTVFLTGARLTAAARFDAAEALKTIAEERITLLEGVPTMYYQMLVHTDIGGADLTSLTRCTVGGQTMPMAKLQAVANRFACPILELWGMTEVGGPATSHSPYWTQRHGSIGMAFPGTHIRIADGDTPSADAPVNAAGELMIRGPLVTKGYWNNAKSTDEAFDADGWFATGDIARMDNDGYLFILDRKKDMILTAGYNVYPAELEQVIAQHPAVAMVAVAGREDDEKGEIAEAFVVRHRDSTLAAEELIAHCRQHLASYKIPRAVHFLDDLPKTSTGKIMRRALTSEHSTAA